MNIFSLYGGFYRGSNVAASLDAADAKSSARHAKTNVQELEMRLDSAMLACEAMWSLLRDKLDMTDDDLATRINDIDLSDGRLDGKVRKPPVKCPKCQKAVSRRMPRCMYCGQPVEKDPFV